MLTAKCSEDPTVSRVWNVRNNNSFAVPFTWQVYGAPVSGTNPLTWSSFIRQSGTGTAAPNADTAFATPTVSGPNPAAIFWTQASSPLGFGFWLSLSTTASCASSARINPQAGQNVNMVSGTGWPGGDPFLQRQNEPSVAFSTRNSLHLVAGANDYRSVDLPDPSVNANDEEYSGDAWLGLFKSFDGGQTWQSTLLPGYPQDTSPEGAAFKASVGAFGAAADPIVRAGTSGLIYYAGIAFNRPVAGDPNPNPTQGALFVSRFIDLNNKENGDATQSLDPVRYLGTAPAAFSSSSAFVDKPSMAVDIPRGGSTCTFAVPQGTGSVAQTVPAGNVYVAYSAITGAGASLQATVSLTKSNDCGASWSAPVPLSSSAQNVSQGAAVAVDPVSGDVYVAWRQFASGTQPNAINVVRVTGGGATVGPVVVVRALPTFTGDTSAAAFFDQGTSLGTFRTNAYPTMAVDGSGRVYLAWTERQPLLLGDARVVLSTSSNGSSWSGAAPIDNAPVTDDFGHTFNRGHQFMPQITFNGGRLTALYYDLRLDHTLGLFTAVPGFPTPDSQGRFELETRALCGSVGVPCASEALSFVFTPFIDDSQLNVRRHTLDLRVAQAGAGASPSFTTRRVSQYKFGTRGDETDPITALQQLQVNPPNLPMFQLGTVPFLGDYIDIAGVPFVQPSPGGPWQFNTAVSKAGTQFAVWTSNQDVIPPYDAVHGVVDWTLYTPPRSVVNTGDGGNTSTFDTTRVVPACDSPFTGSRNQNIYGALVTQDFLFSSPQNSKPLSTTLQRAFVVVAQNLTGSDRTFRLVIENQPPGGWASFSPGTNVPLAAPSPTVTNLDLTVAAHSSAARSVFATSSSPTASITVSIAETSSVGGPLVVNGLTGFVALNSDSSNPGLVPPDGVSDAASINTVEVYMPNVTNPNVTNPNVTNPNVTNPNVTNPNVTNSNLINPNVTNPNVTNPNVTNPNVTNSDIANPNVTNPNVTNPNVTNPNVTNPNVTNPNVTNPNVTNPDIANVNPSDAVYTLTNTGNTAASYRVRLVGTAPSATTQLIITKSYKTLSSQSCELFEQNQELLIANILNPVFTPPSGALNDPGTLDPGANNPTVALKPNESATITLRAFVAPEKLSEIVSGLTPVVVPQAANTNTASNTPTAALPGGTTIVPGTVQVLTAALPDGVVGRPYAATMSATGGVAPYSWDSAGAPPDGVTFGGPGIFGGSPTTVGTSTFTVSAFDSSPTTLSGSRLFTVRVALSLTIPAASLPTGTVGDAYTGSLVSLGGWAPVAWSLASGTLPAGLSLSSGGAITGAPLAAGTSVFFARAADSLNPQQTATQIFSITVNAAGPSLLTFTSSPANVVAGQNFSAALHLQDGAGAPIPGASVAVSLSAAPCAGTAIAGSLTGSTDAGGNVAFSSLQVDRGGVGASLHATAAAAGVSADSHLFGVQGSCGTNPMGVARKWHTATRLANGKVLFAGGFDGTVALASAELFDPATGAFTPTGSMGVPRALHSATLLADGRVLVVGGGSGLETGTLASAELYDPGTGVFSATGSLSGTSRQMHGAVLLNDGSVLIAGGFTNDSSIFGLSTAELYSPGTGTFAATAGNMVHDRIGDFTTTLLADGRVLLAGGSRNSVGGPVQDGELFDPAGGGTFSVAPISMNERRGKHTATVQPNGQVFLAGGESALAILSSTEYFDPSTDSFVVSMSSQPVLLAPRESHTGTRLPDGRILEAGGKSVFGPAVTASAEIYDPASASISATGSLVNARELHTATPLAGGTVLLAGGSGDSGVVLQTAEIFHLPVYVDPNPAFALVTISNVQLNGGGNVLTLPGGGSFTLDHDFVIANPVGCPGCIDQIEVGPAADSNYQACTYNGIPSLTGDAGHGTTTLTVPATSGLYYIGFDYAQTFFCGQFPAWWSGPPGPNRYMAVVIVP